MIGILCALDAEVSRLYELERKLGIDEEKIRVANHRIDDLEQLNTK